MKRLDWEMCKYCSFHDCNVLPRDHLKVTQVRPEHVARMSGKAQTKASLTRGVVAGIAVFGQQHVAVLWPSVQQLFPRLARSLLRNDGASEVIHYHWDWLVKSTDSCSSHLQEIAHISVKEMKELGFSFINLRFLLLFRMCACGFHPFWLVLG